jgi:hypothetical protein
MPAGSSKKRERQYEHIKEGYEKRGQKGRAEEIAARTVNKERAETGEAKNSRKSSSRSAKSSSSSSSSRSGKPSARSGKSSSRSGGERTRAELYQEARKRGVEGRSTMNKAQLEQALSR